MRRSSKLAMRLMSHESKIVSDRKLKIYFAYLFYK